MFIHRENVRDWLIAVAIVLVGAVVLAVLQVVLAHAGGAKQTDPPMNACFTVNSAGVWQVCGGASFSRETPSSGEITAYPASAPDVRNVPATAAMDDIWPADSCYFDRLGSLHCASLHTPRCPDGHPAILSFDGSVGDWDMVGHFYCSQREIVRHLDGWRYLEAEPKDPKEWSGE
jgi:hypothetical protein